MNKWNDPKLALSGVLIVMFAGAFAFDPNDDAMKGALIAAFSAAYGYWLGSSSGSARKTDLMAGDGE